MVPSEAPARPAIGFKHFIGGHWTEPMTSETVPIVDPATEETIALMPKATPAETVKAIEAARKAFDCGPWPFMAPRERSAALKRFVTALEKRRGELREILLRQSASPVRLLDTLRVARPIEVAHWYAERAATFPLVEEVRLDGPPFDVAIPHQKVRLVQRAPAGVVAAITPFNASFQVNVIKVFPALAMGCTVVLKPTPTCCWDAVELAEAAHEAGLPEGVLNVLLGGGPEVGEVMASHPMVDMVTFTGSTGTGRRIMELAAKTVKRVHLELGGKSPHLVFADADVNQFLAFDPSVLRYSGQGCAQLTRILLEDRVHDEVVDLLKRRAEQAIVGPPDDPKTEVGPVISKVQYERIKWHIQAAQQDGAQLVCGGGRPAQLTKGYYIAPTILVGVSNNMRIAQEETFGPVVAIIKFSGEEEAVRIANDIIYGINASVWTKDQAKALRVAGRIQAGNVGLNCIADVTEGPHGGFKQTGIGREWGDWSLREFIELKGYTYLVGG